MIRLRLFKKMEFPITRGVLQNIRPIVDRIDREKYIKMIVNVLKLEIINQAYSAGGNKYLKKNLPINPKGIMSMGEPMLIQYRGFNTSEFLPEVIEQLKLLFPDVSFQVDPLKTYLLIDWS